MRPSRQLALRLVLGAHRRAGWRAGRRAGRRAGNAVTLILGATLQGAPSTMALCWRRVHAHCSVVREPCCQTHQACALRCMHLLAGADGTAGRCAAIWRCGRRCSTCSTGQRWRAGAAWSARTPGLGRVRCTGQEPIGAQLGPTRPFLVGLPITSS